MKNFFPRKRHRWKSERHSEDWAKMCNTDNPIFKMGKILKQVFHKKIPNWPQANEKVQHCHQWNENKINELYYSLSRMANIKKTEYQISHPTCEEFKLLYLENLVAVFTKAPHMSTRSSVQFSRSVVSDCLRPHESQHARPPCPSPTPGAYPNLCPSSQWCHPAISSSVIPFSSCPQSLSASGSFQMSQLFTWGGQSTGISALASVLPMNTQNWSLPYNPAIPLLFTLEKSMHMSTKDISKTCS